MKTVEHLKAPTLTGIICNLTEQPVLLQVEGLRKAFGGQTVLAGVSAELRQGQVVLLRGANGSGKTTLLNMLTGNLVPDAGVIKMFTNGVEEEFRFPQHWWQSLNPFDHFTPEQVARQGVGRTWQDIRLFTTQSLLDNIAVATPGQLGENPGWAIARRAAVLKQERRICKASQAMLTELGLAGRETSSADRVSLGQSKRVAIARAVQAGARILFLDEPLAGLDAPGVAEVMGLLERLACEEQVTLVIVEHVFNIPRILDLATTVWMLESGKVTVETPAKVQAEIKDTSGDGIRDWLREMAGAGGRIEDHQLPGGAVLSKVIPTNSDPGSTVLEVKDLVVYRGKRLVIGEWGKDGQVRGLSFALLWGELAVLQAPNGWGKTTLLEAIAGLIPISCGAIWLNGQPIQDLPSWQRVRLGLALLQARDNIFLGLTVREVLQLSQVVGVPKNIKHLLERPMSELSGGERQKVAIACAINGRAFITGLLDEPLSALDPDAVSHFQSMLINCLPNAGLLVALPSALASAEQAQEEERNYE